MSPSTKINVKRLAYVHYEHSDRKTFDKFAYDFGLVKGPTDKDNNTFYSGYGTDPYCYIASDPKDGKPHNFIAPGFLAKTKEDFDNACARSDAKQIDISKRPGGGEMVEIRDCNNQAVQICWGVEETETTEKDASMSLTGEVAQNGAFEKNRKGGFRRLKRGPAMVHKLGHFGFMTTNYDKTCQWYQDNLNFEVVDVLNDPEDDKHALASFYRISLGDEFVDHHCLLLTREKAGPTRVHHSSFEVEDFDTQLLGHDWLKEQKYHLFWGVGRHVHGSQIFDYWKDTSGYVVEHYADGDVVNDDTPVSIGKFGNGSIWGPKTPSFGPNTEGH